MVSKNMVAVAIALILAVVAVLIIATARPGNEQELLHVAEARAAEAAEPSPEQPKAPDKTGNQDATSAPAEDEAAEAQETALPPSTSPTANETESDNPAAANGMAAAERAAETGRYLFAFFYKEHTEHTRAMSKAFDKAVAQLTDRADSVAIDVAAPAEADIVKKYNLSRSPVPLVLALAPNGVVTGVFTTEVTQEQLAAAIAGPAKQACLKALQQRKIVFLCAQNKSTKSNDAAMQGVNDFKADDRFALFTEIVKIDPSDAAEKKFLEQLRIDPKTAEAITVFLAPPGSVIAKFTGPTDRAGLVATLQKASSGCGTGGCGPSGCAPQK
ncbi:MAG: hypothetical protein HQ592_01135 [Planctomycetes bacterium]|nr:hypothetical protein [Planctomycetota bacterium]